MRSIGIRRLSVLCESIALPECDPKGRLQLASQSMQLKEEAEQEMRKELEGARNS
jgi:hypothetical protein